jgi:hypothetical protein
LIKSFRCDVPDGHHEEYHHGVKKIKIVDGKDVPSYGI